MIKKYQITVTEKQLHIIATACEIYGRILGNQAEFISELIPFVDRGERWDFRKDVKRVLGNYEIDYHRTRDTVNIAFDIWRKIDRKDDFTMGSEPSIDVKEIGENV